MLGNKMKKSLLKTYKIVDKMFPGIGKTCKDCNTCCKTYGWLLKEEAKELEKKGIPIIEINADIFLNNISTSPSI